MVDGGQWMVGGDSVVLTGPCTMDTVYGDLEMGLQHVPRIPDLVDFEGYSWLTVLYAVLHHSYVFYYLFTFSTSAHYT